MADPAPRGLVRVATCLDVSEAYILRGRLESAGIPAILFDENLSRTAWQYLVAVGGVRVMVPAAYEKEARAILAADARAEKENGEEEENGDVCPACASRDVARLFSWVSLPLTVLTLFSTALPVPLRRNRRKCRACAHTWRV